jgi:hypothetical protein
MHISTGDGDLVSLCGGSGSGQHIKPSAALGAGCARTETGEL